MDPERWDRLQSIFFAALKLPDEERAAYLDQTCDDADFRAEVEAVLAAHQRIGGAPSDAGARAGQRLGAYRLEARIGRGGMGEVYRAQRVDEQYRQRVAVKIVRSSLPADEVARRFRVERQVLARLQHPNVAALLDGGVTEDGSPYLVMQYVDGGPVTEYADEHMLSVAERLRLFATVCRAVHFAHSNLVVHRDLKPSNILVTRPAPGEPGGEVRLLDFGIAKLLDPEGMGITAPLTEELLLLTPEHAAPEQIVGGPITTATDVYALGVLLYELLTGTRPFRATLGAGWHRAVCEQEPTHPSAALTNLATAGDLDAPRVAERRASRPAALHQQLRGDLDQIVLKALRKEPERRYASAEQFAEDVERFLEGRPVLARPDTLGYRTRKFLRRNRLALSAAAAGLLLLLGTTAITAHQARARAAALAQAELDRDRYRGARDQLLLESTRASQLSRLLLGLFERGGGLAAEDSAAVQRLLTRGLARAEAMHREPAAQALMLTALGRVHTHVGDYTAAGSLLERSLALQHRLADERRTDIAETLTALAHVRWLSDRAAEAESLLLEALARDSARFADDHPRIARGLSQLARYRQYQANYAGAEQVLREALAMQERIASGDSVSIAAMKFEQALLLRRRGRLREAEALYRETLRIRSRFFAREDGEIGGVLNNLGLVLLELGRAAEAEPLFRESLETQRKLHGSRHQSVAISMNSLARALSDLGRDEEAERLFAETLALRREILGPRHYRNVVALLALGTHHLGRGRHDAAEAHFREALEIQRAVREPGHPDEALALAGIGKARRRSGDLDAAEPLLREAMRLQSDALGAEHPLLAATQLELGLLLQQRGRLDAAEPLLRRAHAINQAALDASAPALAESRWALAAFHRADGPRNAIGVAVRP